MSRPVHHRVRRTVVAVATSALVAGVGTVFAAFTATTSNPGNTISAGSVALADNDGADVPMYTAAGDGNLAPGQSRTKCITVTYTGSLAASVKLYASSPIANGDQFTIQVERDETPAGDAFPSCTGFAATSTAVATTNLNAFAATYAGGYDGKAAGAAWVSSDSVAYRFTLTAKDDPTPNAHTSPTVTGNHTFTWEARNN